MSLGRSIMGVEVRTAGGKMVAIKYICAVGL